ncbi:hypothetical protein TELCIR_17374 [Teladorsagia circumcincta]|uniref:Uncharacterized protein n=1 Tax=Teladorsagia circumcincta TaxID=45464 RepID=A0A2G9TV28_TELCI|nr:hypothetical protein TELCIR_17374 [Teladorsagia circumcincta]
MCFCCLLLIILLFRDLLLEVVKEERQERDRERALLESQRMKEEKVRVVRQLFEQLLDEVIAEKTRAAIKQELGLILVFSPSNYAKCTVHQSKASLALVDSQKIRLSLKLVQFKKARSKRIMRKYFDEWRNYIEIRRTLHSLAKVENAAPSEDDKFCSFFTLSTILCR